MKIFYYLLIEGGKMKFNACWFEIPVEDFGRGVKFYEEIFQIELEVHKGSDESMAFFPGRTGALSLSPLIKPSPDGVLIAFNVDDEMEDILRRVTDTGEKIVVPKTKIDGDHGYFAIISDSEGNRLSLFSNN